MTSSTTTTTTEERALTLLGQGIPPQVVANALGVDVSRISQLLSREDFASTLIERKFEYLSKHNERDDKTDSLEDQLLKKLEHCLPFMTRPMEILKAYQVINAAKRRGATSPDALAAKQTVVQLTIPTVVLQKFTSNVHNQVITVDDKSLLTIQSNQLLKLVENTNVKSGQTPIPIGAETKAN